MQLYIPQCPKCLSRLERNGETLTCSDCGEIYTIDKNIILFLNSITLPEEFKFSQNFFNNLAEAYDNSIVSIVESMGCKWRSYTEALEKMINKTNNRVILDIGCGTGFPAVSFLPKSVTYLGLDFSHEMLKYARNIISQDINATFFNINAENIPLENDSIDVCMSLFSLNSFREPERIVEKVSHLVRRKGSVIISIPVAGEKRQNSDINRPIREEALDAIFFPLVHANWEVSYFQCGSVRIYNFIKT